VSAPRVSVVTMSFNQRDKVVQLAADLAGQDYDPRRIELVVIDDGSTDGTTAALRRQAAGLPYRLWPLRRERAGEYLSALRWNDAIAHSDPESRIFVQVDDVRVRPDFIRRHVSWHDGPLRLVTGAKFEGDQLTWDLSACRRSHLAGPQGSASVISAWTACWGASMSYPRRLVELVSDSGSDRPYDERMTGWGHQEVEFAYRCHRAGAELIYDPAAGVFHQNHGPANDAGRGLDHALAWARGDAANAEYVCRKHGLAALPRW
jgi:glycosyltransferase involved in cell wall biosynthesis